MKINLDLPHLTDLRPRLTVVGVGGAGSNAVNNMITSGLAGVTFVVANTDAQSLAGSSAERKIQLGVSLTEGLGAGAKPEIGEAAAEEAIEEIRNQLAGSHMVFIAAGMGGGTGTGAAAVIARIAREVGSLTVGVVTKPFQFEGSRRMRAAEEGIAALRPHVDTLIVIPNQNLFRVANEKTTFSEAFVMADQVLYAGIACIVDLIVKDGLINLDFADVRTVMANMGTAMMGTGEAAGDRRAVQAAEEAISNPLLDDVSLKGARGLLVSITGGQDLTLYEVDEAANRVRQEVDPEATIIVGATFDETIGDRLRVSIVASGMDRIAGTATYGRKDGFRPAVSAHQPAAQTAPSIAAAVVPAEMGAWGGAPPAQVSSETHADQSALDTIAAQSAAAAKAETWMPQPAAATVPHGEQSLSAAIDAVTRATRSAEYEAPEPLAPAAAEASPLPRLPLPPHRQSPAAQSGRDGLPASYGELGPAVPRPQWISEGGAMFEDAPPPFATMPAATPPAPHLQPEFEPLQPHQGGAAFEPSPPVEPKRGARRLPGVDDFPPVGQREYHAKRERYGEAERAPPRAYTPPQEPPRKLGFFERLTGARRRQPATGHDSNDERARAAENSRRGAEPRGHGGARDAQSSERATGREEPGENTELPVFFGNQPRR